MQYPLNKNQFSLKYSSCIVQRFWVAFKVLYGAFRLSSFCIGRRLPMLVFCLPIRFVRTNIHNTQSWRDRLALADVDRCTAMKSECTITVRFTKIKRKESPGSRFITVCMYHFKLAVVQIDILLEAHLLPHSAHKHNDCEIMSLPTWNRIAIRQYSEYDIQ